MLKIDTKKILKLGGIIIGCIVLGGVLEHFIIEPRFFWSSLPFGKGITAASSNFSFVKPLLAIDFSENKHSVEYKEISKILNDSVSKNISQNLATQISIYFRDLKTAEWVEINEDLPYDPASLLKVPIMMAYYKQAETDPGVLSKKLAYDSTEASDIEANQFQHPLSLGQEYTVEQLIENMIIYSDNKAMLVLLKNSGNISLDEIFSVLGIEPPDQVPAGEYVLSAKNYALFFRVLRNATYLNPQMSEKALELLTKTTFHDALVAGVPDGMPVAHKFGLRAIESNNLTTGIELHDCGIVYDPSDNYLLCVMTKGSDLQNLKAVIKNISSAVYNEVSSTLTP